MKMNPIAKQLASALLDGGRVIDPDSETSHEIATKLGIKQTTAKDRIRKFIEEGKLERVWKRVNGIMLPSYRVKQ